MQQKKNAIITMDIKAIVNHTSGSFLIGRLGRPSAVGRDMPATGVPQFWQNLAFSSR